VGNYRDEHRQSCWTIVLPHHEAQGRNCHSTSVGLAWSDWARVRLPGTPFMGCKAYSEEQSLAIGKGGRRKRRFEVVFEFNGDVDCKGRAIIYRRWRSLACSRWPVAHPQALGPAVMNFILDRTRRRRRFMSFNSSIYTRIYAECPTHHVNTAAVEPLLNVDTGNEGASPAA
jgi:hypothetical protein